MPIPSEDELKKFRKFYPDLKEDQIPDAYDRINGYIALAVQIGLRLGAEGMDKLFKEHGIEIPKTEVMKPVLARKTKAAVTPAEDPIPW